MWRCNSKVCHFHSHKMYGCACSHAVNGVQNWIRECLGGGLVLCVCSCALLQVLLAKAASLASHEDVKTVCTRPKGVPTLTALCRPSHLRLSGLPPKDVPNTQPRGAARVSLHSNLFSSLQRSGAVYRVCWPYAPQWDWTFSSDLRLANWCLGEGVGLCAALFLLLAARLHRLSGQGPGSPREQASTKLPLK
jgi:hypothetical protein